MAEQGRRPLAFAALLGLAALVGLAWWGVREPSPVVHGEAGAPGTAGAEPAAAPESAGGEASAPALEIEIPPHGRISLRHEDLPRDGAIAVTLGLPDEVRGEGDHPVRLVSVAGKRVDLVARPRPGSGSGLRLDLDPALLAPGRYMIEVETRDPPPLPIRRFVLEIL